MGPALNINQSVTGQPWRWRRAPDPSIGDGYTRRRAAARPRSGARRSASPPRSRNPRFPARSRPASGTWTKAPSGLADAVQKGETIAIFGDYDVDGATSAALLVLLLRRLGRGAHCLHPRPADGGLRTFRQSARRIEGARRHARRLRRLRRAGVRGARASGRGGTRRHRRRPPPVRDACFRSRMR